MSPISKKYRKSNTLTFARFDQSMGAPIVLGILFFFVLCLGASDVIRKTAMVVAIASLLVVAVRFNVLRERLHWPFIALTLYVIMDGVSTFYAVSGKFALREFLKVFLAFGMAVILLATAPKKEETTGKRIATILAVCTAIGSLVSIDLISTRWISGAVTGVLGWFTEGYEELEGSTGGRFSSLFSNSNVFAGFSGLGMILSLGLAEAADSRKERCCFLVMLYLDIVAFLLAISLGAIAFAVVACVVMLLLQKGHGRAGLLFLLLEAAVFAGASAALILKTSDPSGGVHALPLLCICVGAAVLCLLDAVFVNKWIRKHAFKRKTAVITLIVCLVLIAAAAIVALSATDDLVLSNGAWERRAAFPKAGEYTLHVQADGAQPRVRITSQNWEEIKRGNETVLYEGSDPEAAFTVPDGSVAVFVTFSTQDVTRITSASFGQYRLPLHYRFLPASIAARFHAPGTLNSVAQRLVYFKDGIKLFKRSPIVGLGMGAFENAIKSVQSYYYETKYAHNHYFQTMLETGIIGLILFLSLLVFSAIAIWKTRKKHPYAPMLGAALVFMAGQALHDIVFSAYAYLPVAYGTFAMINLCCGEEIAKPKLSKTVKTVVIGVAAACTVLYCFLLAGNIIAKQKVEDEPTLETLVVASRLDRFEWADYMLPYVVNAAGDDVGYDVRRQADAFAARLARVNSNTIPIYLAEYYFKTGRPEDGIRMIEKYVDYLSSDQNAWQQAFYVLRTYADDSEAFRDGVARIYQKMLDWNEENAGTIQLNEATTAFIAAYTEESS